MRYTSERVLAFARCWAASHPAVAMERAINAAFPDLDGMEPPIDVRRLADRRRIRVVDKKIDVDGLIFREGGEGYVVYLNTHRPEGRQRFTLAHEIAHTFFFDAERPSADFGTANHGGERRDVEPEEERLCDYGAARILMPRKPIMALLKKWGPSAHFVIQVARAFKVSIRASARHLARSSDSKVMVAKWQYVVSRSRFETLWVEEQETAREKVAIEIGIEQPVFRDFLAKEDFRGRRWMSLGGALDHYFVDAVVLEGQRKSWITTILFDPLAEKRLPAGHNKSGIW